MSKLSTGIPISKDELQKNIFGYARRNCRAFTGIRIAKLDISLSLSLSLSLLFSCFHFYYVVLTMGNISIHLLFIASLAISVICFLFFVILKLLVCTNVHI